MMRFLGWFRVDSGWQAWARLPLAVLLFAETAAGLRADDGYMKPPIDYANAPADDPVARLQRRLDSGELSLEHDGKDQGYLKSVLDALGVPVESQGLVFSKTSFQAARISPRSPRAIYFSDEVYVGWVRGGDLLEFSAVDPQLGAVFYVLDQDRSARPRFERQTHSCLACHATISTQRVPGHLVRSVFPDPGGLPIFNAGSFITDHESPLEKRWGGWYVTGRHGDQAHMGNMLVRDRDNPRGFDRTEGANQDDLDGRFDVGAYPTPHSDIVALMVLEHQTQMHNRITAANYQARMARHYDEGVNKAFDRPIDHVSDSSRRRIESASEALVRYMLFVDEAPLSAPISGTSGFAEQFAGRGPRDPSGRSLRDLDLQTRLFRYPCSYLIYSEAFDALPQTVKRRVYERLGQILDGDDDSPEFAHLTPELRREILEILLATKPDFAEAVDGPP